MLGASRVITDGLAQAMALSEEVQIAVCSAIETLSDGHVVNATRLGATPGILSAIVKMLLPLAPPSRSPSGTSRSVQTAHLPTSSGSGGAGAQVHGVLQEWGPGQAAESRREAACSALIHLLWKNEANKLAVIGCNGMLKALAAVLADARYPSSQALVAKVIAACSDNFGAAGGAAAASAHPHSTGASSHIAAATNAGMCSLRPSGIPAVESHLSIPPPCHCFCGRDDPPLPARQAERISSTPGVLRCLNELLRDGTATFAESGIHAPAPRPPARQLAAVAAAASLSDHAGSRPLLRAAHVHAPPSY